MFARVGHGVRVSDASIDDENEGQDAMTVDEARELEHDDGELDDDELSEPDIVGPPD